MPSAESALVIGRGYNTFIYEDEPRYTVLSAVSRAVKEDEKISGDNFSLEEYNQSQVVVMLADGIVTCRRAGLDELSFPCQQVHRTDIKRREIAAAILRSDRPVDH